MISSGVCEQDELKAYEWILVNSGQQDQQLFSSWSDSRAEQNVPSVDVLIRFSMHCRCYEITCEDIELPGSNATTTPLTDSLHFFLSLAIFSPPSAG